MVGQQRPSDEPPNARTLGRLCLDDRALSSWHQAVLWSGARPGARRPRPTQPHRLVLASVLTLRTALLSRRDQLVRSQNGDHPARRAGLFSQSPLHASCNCVTPKDHRTKPPAGAITYLFGYIFSVVIGFCPEVLKKIR